MHSGAGDAPDFLRNPSWYIIEKYFSLPGGVLLSIRDGETQANNKKVYSLPNIHGDIMRTANAIGTKVTDFFYSPFGQILEFGYNNLVTPNTPTVGQPQNSYTYTSFSWVGKNQKFDESSFVLNPIQMGARVYIPGIGRFLQVDSIEGGTANAYVYPNDPVNSFDFDGRCIGRFLSTCARAIPFIDKWSNRSIRYVKAAYASKKASSTLTKNATKARQLASQGKLTYADGAKKHLDRPYMDSNLHIQQIMKGNPISDPKGSSGAVAWREVGVYNNSLGTWELVVNPGTQQIYHYVFKSFK